MQHSGIGSFGKWDGVLILYHGLITKMVYCTALILCIVFFSLPAKIDQWQIVESLLGWYQPEPPSWLALCQPHDDE